MHFFQNYGMEPGILFHQLHLMGESFPSHYHRAYELLLVQQGTLLLTVDGVEEELLAGDGAFIFGNQIHIFHAQPETHLEVLIIAPELIPDFHQLYQEKLPITNRLPQAAAALSIQEHMTVFQIKACVYDCCARLLNDTEFRELRNSKSSELLLQMLRWIMSHYQKTVTLDQLASQLNYDYKYLSKLFIRGTGMGFNEYVNHLRIIKARELLQTTELSIQEIAHLCGYEAVRTFNRNYKKITQHAPSEERRAH